MRNTFLPEICNRNLVYQVLIIGHSNIRRLGNFGRFTTSHSNLRLYHSAFDIQFGSQGGLTVPQLIHKRLDLYIYSPPPYTVFIQLGGNDLSFHPVNEVVNSFIAIAFSNFSHSRWGFNLVIIGEL